MKITKIVSLLLAALATVHTAQAGEIATTFDLGTTGLGLHLTAPLAPKLNARAGLNTPAIRMTATPRTWTTRSS